MFTGYLRNTCNMEGLGRRLLYPSGRGKGMTPSMILPIPTPHAVHKQRVLRGCCVNCHVTLVFTGKLRCMTTQKGSKQTTTATVTRTSPNRTFTRTRIDQIPTEWGRVVQCPIKLIQCRVVRKLVCANPGLRINQSINSSCIKCFLLLMFRAFQD